MEQTSVIQIVIWPASCPRISLYFEAVYPAQINNTLTFLSDRCVSQTDNMSRFLNVLRSWLVMVSVIAIGNTVQSFKDHSFLSEKLYTGTPEFGEQTRFDWRNLMDITDGTTLNVTSSYFPLNWAWCWGCQVFRSWWYDSSENIYVYKIALNRKMYLKFVSAAKTTFVYDSYIYVNN